MKKKITITVDKETMLRLETMAKERNMTVIQLAEELFERMVKRLQSEEELKELS